jgi:hypothetical protein
MVAAVGLPCQIDDVIPFAVAVYWFVGPVFPPHASCTALHIAEIGEQYIFSKVIKLMSGIPGQPVFDYSLFCIHMDL